MLWLARPDGALWLSRRPSPGVWANLYCFPLFDSEQALRASVPVKLRSRLQAGAAFTHGLTHKDLHLHPVRLLTRSSADPATDGAWYGADQCKALGMPAPVRRLLQEDGNQPNDVDG